MEELEVIKAGQLNELREKLYNEQDGVCPILKIKLPIEQFVVDHEHRKNKHQTVGENGAGLVRGAIQRHANALEGKITNNWHRYGMDKFDVSLPDFLRNLADYLDSPNTNIIHPSELPRPQIVKKSSYNQLKKAFLKDGGEESKFPPYRVSPKDKNIQKLTKPLAKLFEKYGIDPDFY